jgi:hypothetical protein
MALLRHADRPWRCPLSGCRKSSTESQTDAIDPKQTSGPERLLRRLTFCAVQFAIRELAQSALALSGISR